MVDGDENTIKTIMDEKKEIRLKKDLSGEVDSEMNDNEDSDESFNEGEEQKV
jgi:hypothetical protein